jgi:cysteine desulfurase
VNATAACGRIPVDVEHDGIDLLTISSNDMYGPRGAAALYVRKGIKVQPLLPGGGQENGIRSGTENVFAIAGMGEAAVMVQRDMISETKRLQSITDAYQKEILNIPESFLTGSPYKRLPGHMSFSLAELKVKAFFSTSILHSISRLLPVLHALPVHLSHHMFCLQ